MTPVNPPAVRPAWPSFAAAGWTFDTYQDSAGEVWLEVVAPSGATHGAQLPDYGADALEDCAALLAWAVTQRDTH